MTKPAISTLVGRRCHASPARNKNSRNLPRALRHLRALLLAFVMAGAAHPASAERKPEPSGIYDLLFGAPGTGRIDLTDHPLLNNPNIDGFRYKTGWAKIQPDNATTYNWESIDSAIAIAAAHGKKLCISIAGGFSVPDWVYTSTPVVYKYTMLEIDPATRLSIGSQPLPWDTAYLDKWQTFLAAFAARYETNPACSYVVMGGFMQTFNMVVAGGESDFNAMENLAKNPPPGYPGLVTSYPDFSAAYIPAAQRVMTDYATSFPTTSLLLTMLRVVPGDLGVTLQNTVSEWGKATFPGQVGTMVSALYANLPPHAPPPPPVNYPKGFQMVCGAVDDPARLYLAPDPVPMTPNPIPLQHALQRGVSLGGKFVEVYQQDLVPEISQPVLAVERLRLIANVGDGTGSPPGPPSPPTNLRVVP